MSELKCYPPLPSLKPASVLYQPKDAKYQKENRLWQGCPSIAKTKGGRIYAAWGSGGVKEPAYGNYNIIWYSDDEGETWKENYIVIEADEVGNHDRATDVNLWIAPDGSLYATYVQMRVIEAYMHIDILWGLFDNIFGTWHIKCSDPDAENPVFEAPVRWCDGYARNQPTVLSNGDWFLPAYDWILPCHGKSDSFLGRGKGTYNYHFRISHDEGKTWELVVGPEKYFTHEFEEGMMVEGLDGKWHVFLRGRYATLHSESADRGLTWSPEEAADFPSSGSRFYVRRLKSGNVIMVNSGPNRTGLFARISKDDCKTWSEPLVLDERDSVSYPDGMQCEDGKIYVIYDRERYAAREILYSVFTEEDIEAKAFVTEGSFTKKIISKLYSERPE